VRVRIIDLRSDTVTRPTPGMREAMAKAAVGDDVYGEDPSVNRLQERVAALLGKAAALFFPSGTMANQAALRLHTRPGDVVLASRDAHILRAEAGAAAGLSGLQIETIGQGGVFTATELRAALPAADVHMAPATLLAVENTHNAAGGRVFPPGVLGEALAAARDAGLALHCDGARLWNAAVALGRPPAELAAPFDTVSVCLSKGLGAPVGSLVAGTRAHVEALRRVRKMLGGGMRQAGVLAAAGEFALDHQLARLAEDHANARRLARGLAAFGFEVDENPETNIVLLRSGDAGALQRQARERGVLLSRTARSGLRAVTHLDVGEADVDEALARLAPLAPPPH
jgi:threonine aldolase